MGLGSDPSSLTDHRILPVRASIACPRITALKFFLPPGDAPGVYGSNVVRNKRWPHTAIPLWPVSDHNHNQFSTLQERHVFSPTLLNQFSFSFSRPLETETEPFNAPGGALLRFGRYFWPWQPVSAKAHRTRTASSRRRSGLSARTDR